MIASTTYDEHAIVAKIEQTHHHLQSMRAAAQDADARAAAAFLNDEPFPADVSEVYEQLHAVERILRGLEAHRVRAQYQELGRRAMTNRHESDQLRALQPELDAKFKEAMAGGYPPRFTSAIEKDDVIDSIRREMDSVQRRASRLDDDARSLSERQAVLLNSNPSAFVTSKID